MTRGLNNECLFKGWEKLYSFFPTPYSLLPSSIFCQHSQAIAQFSSVCTTKIITFAFGAEISIFIADLV